ncbi:hypothetical protein LC087_11885 [Bacillus carboniphilus]|uniref:Uncharacterized protein n=1 Tax=Bacillus carboniphilus TaxID=86663 RepID=A0ABY9K0M0_9BACI|nr:hypothetical protein [Bacillus carboniphilus]WLR44387.1 hypothetical protein LC087_11885 [Bacillus carboniphilus]
MDALKMLAMVNIPADLNKDDEKNFFIILFTFQNRNLQLLSKKFLQ